jgi:hypothetical protein
MEARKPPLKRRTTMNKLASTIAGFIALAALALPLGVAFGNGAFDGPAEDFVRGDFASSASVPNVHVPHVIVLDDVIIHADAAPKARTGAKPCIARNEGTRDLVQGFGKVRTYTFCGR